MITRHKLKMQRGDEVDEASRREEARREAIRQQMNGDEELTLGVTAEEAPRSSFERAVAEKLKDKDGLHRMMLAKNSRETAGPWCHSHARMYASAPEAKALLGNVIVPDR